MNAIPELLDRFDAQAAELQAAVAGLTPEQLQSHPVHGTWSIQQLVLHLADADAAFFDRMRRIIAEDNPVLQAWDESRFAERLHYEAQAVDDALLLIAAGRRQMSRILRLLAPEAFARTGQHSVRGSQTLAEVVEYSVRHVEHHDKFLQEKLKRLRR